MKEQKVTEFAAIPDLMASKAEDINVLVWKGKDGKEVRLLDMDQEQLQKAYNHVTDMLYNKNKYTPGRYQVKKNIQNLITSCNAELLLRYITHVLDIECLKTNAQVIEFLRNGKKIHNLSDNDSVMSLFINLPSEYNTVTISKLMDACFDKLDIINRKMISDNFIVAQGIWLTEDEKAELTEYDENGKMRPWLDVIKERLFLNNIKLRVDPKGFSYAEFRNLVNLETLPKISRLSSDTLRLLRDKVFLLLDADTDYHISKWEALKKNLEKVAEYKNIELVSKEY